MSVELLHAVNSLRQRGLVVTPQPTPRRVLNVVPMKPRIFALLDRAYKRRCFVCDAQGDCGHREQKVEIAILEVNHGV